MKTRRIGDRILRKLRVSKISSRRPEREFALIRRQREAGGNLVSPLAFAGRRSEFSASLESFVDRERRDTDLNSGTAKIPERLGVRGW